ncbi:RhoGAP-domain-containing protein [Fomitiporia mediterranea MF3/22]|uniref:RhoGAP-domain-containing protein n=1 Tax=Fomitiporia mediterranea (strain MF3/22) TaxID=694068 RepID=UPI00044082E4|nr:RhoGAP-domain-containing protein [Fomitiporia mediterranea MF3/22]EJC98922.1 RhoGAP-domain-containing protein [Fomitiporia mediterranea MF3/22]
MPQPSLTLKQRLANLSQAASGSSSSPATAGQKPALRSVNFGAIGSAFARRRASFNAPWSTAGSKAASRNSESNGDSRKVDEVLSQMIFQAGVDYEFVTLVVMNASAFPDPRTTSYDLLLSRILSYLDLFVESDYTIVFFAAGGHHTPTWNWVWKAYRSLSRKYRKNLKRLYIVHSSFFSKMLFSLAGAIISPKFFRKITYIDTLSSLACHVPLTQIDIPPTVYSENLKHESQIELPTPTHSRMFGVSLEELMGFEGEKDGLPRVVRDCIQYLQETGLEDEGLFRRSPNSVQLRHVQEAYNRGQTVSLQSFGDPHLAAVLLKKFLRDLPEPVFPESLYDTIKRCPNSRDDHDDMSAVLFIRTTLLPELPPCKLILLSNILLLLHEVSLRSEKNRMDAHNLAIVLTPNLVASGNPLKDVAICAVEGAPEPLSPRSRSTETPFGVVEGTKGAGRTTLGTIIRLCIQRYFEVFDEVVDRSDAVEADPFRVGEPEEVDIPSSSSSSPELSSSPTTTKRQSLLHDDESIDDTMLVMPVGPNGTGNGSSPTMRRFPGSGSRGQLPREWPPRTGGRRDRDVHSFTSSEDRHGRSPGGGSLSGTMSRTKARSLFAPATDGVTMMDRRAAVPTSVSASGTLRKAPGAAVTAHSITASGFFTPPESMPSLSERVVQSTPQSSSPLPPPLHPQSGQKRNG